MNNLMATGSHPRVGSLLSPKCVLLFLVLMAGTLGCSRALPSSAGSAATGAASGDHTIPIMGNSQLDARLREQLLPVPGCDEATAELGFRFAQRMVRALGGGGANFIGESLAAKGIDIPTGYGARLDSEIANLPSSQWVALVPGECRVVVLDSVEDIPRPESYSKELADAGIEPTCLLAITLSGVAQRKMPVTRIHYLAVTKEGRARLLNTFYQNRISIPDGGSAQMQTQLIKHALGAPPPPVADTRPVASLLGAQSPAKGQVRLLAAGGLSLLLLAILALLVTLVRRGRTPAQ